MSVSPTTARSKDDLASAYFRMTREGYRHLPVIDDQGILVGIISDRDFQRAMWPMATTDAHGLPDSPNFPKEAKVAQFMTSPVFTLAEETELLTAVNLMIEKKVSALAVMQGDKITGIITHEDLLRMLAVLLDRPARIADKIEYLTFQSPLSQIPEILATAGI